MTGSFSLSLYKDQQGFYRHSIELNDVATPMIKTDVIPVLLNLTLGGKTSNHHGDRYDEMQVQDALVVH